MNKRYQSCIDICYLKGRYHESQDNTILSNCKRYFMYFYTCCI